MFPVRVLVESVRPNHCLTCANDGQILVDTYTIINQHTQLNNVVETVLSTLGFPHLIQDSRGRYNCFFKNFGLTQIFQNIFKKASPLSRPKGYLSPGYQVKQKLSAGITLRCAHKTLPRRRINKSRSTARRGCPINLEGGNDLAVQGDYLAHHCHVILLKRPQPINPQRNSSSPNLIQYKHQRFESRKIPNSNHSLGFRDSSARFVHTDRLFICLFSGDLIDFKG